MKEQQQREVGWLHNWINDVYWKRYQNWDCRPDNNNWGSSGNKKKGWKITDQRWFKKGIGDKLFENIQEQKDILQEKIDIIETSVKHDILNEEKPKAESKFQDMHENSDKENAKQCKSDRKEYRKTEKVNVPFTIIQSQYVMNLLSTRMS